MRLLRHHRNPVHGKECVSDCIRNVLKDLGIELTLPSAICPHSPKSARKRKAKDVSKDPLIYLLLNLVNGKGYVGKAMKSHTRMWEHETGKTMRGNKKGKLQVIDYAIQKHGWHNFLVVWLETNVPPDQLLSRESYWMQRCDTMVPNGYNILAPGVEIPSMENPVFRSRWEASQPAGIRKATETKRKKREEKLSAMNPDVAEKLRGKLAYEAEHNRKRHRGEALPPDGRYGRNEKRRATFARKREERMALMSPDEREKYARKNAASRRSDEKRKEKRVLANKSPSHVAWMKEYRQKTKDKRLRLG